MPIKYMIGCAIAFAVLVIIVAHGYIKDAPNRKIDALRVRLDKVSGEIKFYQDWRDESYLMRHENSEALLVVKQKLKSALLAEIKKMESRLR